MGYFRQLFLEYLYLKILLLTIAYLGRKYNLNILHFDVRKENFMSHPRGPKKTRRKFKRTRPSKRPHVSTAKILSKIKTEKQTP